MQQPCLFLCGRAHGVPQCNFMSFKMALEGNMQYLQPMFFGSGESKSLCLRRLTDDLQKKPGGGNG